MTINNPRLLTGIGKRIHHAVKMSFRSIKAFSEMTGVPYPSLKSYLSGASRPGADALATISAATGYSIDWLVTGKEMEVAITPEERTLIERYRSASPVLKKAALAVLTVEE